LIFDLQTLKRQDELLQTLRVPSRSLAKTEKQKNYSAIGNIGAIVAAESASVLNNDDRNATCDFKSGNGRRKYLILR
jgi:hypothetical protein